MASTAKTRAPTGVDSDRPVLMRLMPDERAMLVGMAEASQQSLSATAREIFLRGLRRTKPQKISKPGEDQ